MVFYFIACHRKDESEEQMEGRVKDTVTSGAKPLGEVYNIVVILEQIIISY